MFPAFYVHEDVNKARKFVTQHARYTLRKIIGPSNDYKRSQVEPPGFHNSLLRRGPTPGAFYHINDTANYACASIADAIEAPRSSKGQS